MTSYKTIKIILSIIILISITLTFTQVVQAQDETPKPIYFTPQVGIGDKVKVGKEIEVGSRTFANYVIAIYNWSIRAIVLLAIVMIMIAGSRWMMAGGNAALITQAKNQIISALIGLVIAIGSYTLLNFINPSLVRLGSLEIDPIGGVDLSGWPSEAIPTDWTCKIETIDDGICWDMGGSYKSYKNSSGPGWECIGGACPGQSDEVICCKLVASSCDEIKDEVICKQIRDPLCMWKYEENRCYGHSKAEWSKLYGNITGTTTYTDGRWVEKVMLVASYYSESTNDYRWALSEVDNSPDETDNDYSVEVYVPISTDLSRGVYGLLWVVTRDPWAIDDKYCVGLNNDAHRTSASTDCVLSNYPSTAFSLLTDEDGQDLQINLDITAGDYQED